MYCAWPMGQLMQARSVTNSSTFMWGVSKTYQVQTNSYIRLLALPEGDGNGLTSDRRESSIPIQKNAAGTMVLSSDGLSAPHLVRRSQKPPG